MLPAPIDIDSDEIADMWDDCFLLQINNRDALEITGSYNYVGDNLRPMFIEGLGKVAHLVSLPEEKLQDRYREMMMTNLPIVENVEEHMHEGRSIKYRQCLLPLGKNGVITHIFGGMRYKYS